ncbi:MAG: accessory gene regulator B family protein [Ruminococcus flavefaciens]|nr:accessory gene regulator B family protein [Ruminococcus flavefaciens]
MEHIMNKVQAEYGYSDYQMKLIKFSLTAIFYDVSKTIILMIYFYATGKFLEFFFAAVPMVLLRMRNGGIHCKKYWTCFLASFVYFYSVINLLPVFITVHPLAIYPILLVCAVVDYAIGPTSLKERAPVKKSVINKAKIQSFQVVFLVAVLIFIFQDTSYLIVSFWTVVLHTVQLSITKFMKEVKHYEKLA